MPDKKVSAGRGATIALVFGTRPEVIKMAPLVRALTVTEGLRPLVVSTGQHRELVAPLFDWFGLTPDRDLALMKPGQTPQEVLARAMTALDELLAAEMPDAVLVQGDTSTALAGALAAFHRKIPVGHVEAGLRTGDLHSPFPEEANRSLISRVTRWHFAPTARAVATLSAERVPGEIVEVGNTVVDALMETAERLPAPSLDARRLVLVTAHRRENFGDAMAGALGAIRTLAERYPETDFVYPVHRNPAVFDLAHGIFARVENVRLIEPVDYASMVGLIRRAYLIISDSGGVQEEAPSFGVPILIMRDSTERPEVVEAGIGELVGTDPQAIISRASFYLDSEEARAAISSVPSPFGDGRAATRICNILQRDFA